MNTENGENIKKLLLTTPDHGIVCAPYLIKQGFSHDNLKQYVQHGYLDSVGRGAYCKHGSTPSFASAIAAAAEQLALPLHLGGWSALARLGLLHFLPAVERPETLYSQPNVRIPAWMKNSFKGHFTSRQTNFLPPHLDIETSILGGFRIPVSTQERAILEYLLDVPSEHPVSEAYQIMEMMVNARAPVLQELLERCNSIKVKRLFFLLSEDLNHSWYEDLNLTHIDFGSGNRVIDKDGTYRRKWLLTIRDWRII